MKCIPFFHKWGKWRTVVWNTGHSYVQVRYCEKCHKEAFRQKKKLT